MSKYKIQVTKKQKAIIISSLQVYDNLLACNFSGIINELTQNYSKQLSPYYLNYIEDIKYYTIELKNQFVPFINSEYRHKNKAKDIIELISKKNIVLSANDIHVLVRVLDLYGRLGLGQLNFLTDELIMFYIHDDFNYEKARDLCDDLKRFLFNFQPNSSYGIHSKQMHNNFREAYDMQQVLRHRVSWDNNPEGGTTVNFDIPFKTSTNKKSQFIKIEKIDA